MPKRQNLTIRVDAQKAQGEGAYIELQVYSWAERRVLQEKMDKIPLTPVRAYNLGMTALLVDELKTHLVGWNFVDSKDNPTPVGDLDALIDGEIDWVFRQMQLLIKQALSVGKEVKEEIKN